jgi:hypothetical protein
MSAERSQILSAKNDVLQIALPYLAGTLQTYTTASIAATGTTLTVKDNSDFANNDYLILGNVGQEQTEIVKIGAAVTAGTSLTIGATVFAHPEGTKVTLIRYNQVEIYGSTTASDAAPTIIGSAASIDVAQGYNEIKASTTYTYYYARYKNSNASTYSSYSDSVVATGLSVLARGEIKKEFLSMYNERIDDLITDDWLNRTINRWQRILSKRKKNWSFLRTSTTSTTVQDQQGYTSPTDIQEDDSTDPIISIKFSDKSILDFRDQDTFLRLTRDHIGTTLATSTTGASTSFVLTNSKDFASPAASNTSTFNIQGDSITYTTNTKSTNTLSGATNVTDSHTAADEVWQTYTTGQPVYYTVDNGKIRLYPIPDSASANKNIHIEYWKKFTDLSDDADETSCIYPENCYLYLYAQAGLRRRLSLDEQIARKAQFDIDLENMVSEDSDVKTLRLEPRNYYVNPY